MRPFERTQEELYAKFAARTPGLLLRCEEVEFALPLLWAAFERFDDMYQSNVKRSPDPSEPRVWLWNLHRGLRAVRVDNEGRVSYGDTITVNTHHPEKPQCRTADLTQTLSLIHTQLADPLRAAEARDLYILAHPKPVLKADPRAGLFLEEVLEMINQHEGAARLVITGMVGELPSILSSFLPVLDLPYPDESDIRQRVSAAAGALHPKFREATAVPSALVHSLRGLNWRALETTAREVAVRLSDPAQAIAYAADAKVAAVRSIAPFVTLQPTVQTPPPVVGMEVIKERIEELGQVLRTPETGVPPGYAMLLAGPPGTGKSIMTHWMSARLKVPVLQQSTGAVFKALVGSTDERQRQVHAMARAMGAHIYSMDEVEKQLPDMRGSQSDGGHGSRYLSGELSFRQAAFDEGLPIYFVDTANLEGLDSLPPEFYSRYTEIFFVDHPTQELLAEIFRAHLGRIANEGLEHDVAALAAALTNALAGPVTNIRGEQVRGERRAVGRDVVMVIKTAQLQAAKRSSNLPSQDELLATILDVRDGLVALDSRGVVLARRTDRPVQAAVAPITARAGHDGLMSLQND